MTGVQTCALPILKYAFIKQQAGHYAIRRLCLTLKVHPSGYYAWLSEPKSARAKDDQRLLGLIKHSWLESGGVYGYRKIHDDLREVGEYASGQPPFLSPAPKAMVST